MQRLVMVALACAAAMSAHAQSDKGQALPFGALARANLDQPRSAPPFDLTGTWQHELRGPQSWKFVPETFKLTPEAQAHYDAGQRALAAGKLYRDDIGQCWPAGMPLIMTRVWPFALLQVPTAIYMISGFMNSLRIIYLDGRPHSEPDIVVPSFNGESIGRWEGDTLVVDTRYFPGQHHWMDQGGASIPASDQLHIIERIRMIEGGATLEIEYTMSDPKSWEGEWRTTKRFNRQENTDIMPHSWIHLDVTDQNGAVASWTIEMNPASSLVKRGWRASTLKPGDHVAVLVYPLRNDEKGGQYISITLPDGQVLAERDDGVI